MSLDVYLIDPTATYETESLYSANITHNLGEMADEIGAKYAKDIIEIVEKGLSDLREKPEYFEQFNSPNGWGMYEHFVPFVAEYLDALKAYPEAKIEVCR